MDDNQDLNKPSKPPDDLCADLPARYGNPVVIARGGMGVLYRVSDLQLGEELAVKVLDCRFGETEKAKQRFLRECKTLAQLDHANIVKIKSSGITESGSFFYVMELLDGHTLASEIGEGKSLSGRRFYEIFRQVLSGLQEAHKQKIIHRDIKPGNIMICDTDDHGSASVKLIDFGIAFCQDDLNPSQKLTATGSLLGSPLYMSPEQCQGAEISPKSDIYSLGCVMYEALSGWPPYRGETAIEIMYKHANSELPELSAKFNEPSQKELAKLIERMLSRRPEDRPSSIQEIQKELEANFAGLNTGNWQFFQKMLPGARTKFLPVFFLSAFLILASLSFFAVKLALKKESMHDLYKAEQASVEKEKRRKMQDLSAKLRLATKVEHLLAVAKSKEERYDNAKHLRDLFYQIGRYQRDLGDYRSAIGTARRSMKLVPVLDDENDNHQARQLLEIAYSLEKLKQKDAALEELNSALALKIEDAESLALIAQQRAVFLLQKQEYELAYEDVLTLISTVKTGGEMMLYTRSTGGIRKWHSSVSLCNGLLQYSLPQVSVKDAGQAEQILKIYLSIAAFLLAEENYQCKDQLLNGISQMLAKLKPEGKYKALRQEGLDMLARYKTLKQAQK